ncbi:unnamed protein product [Didymodactylos carnosus]|uniref:Uncharacterized protein n=1 Tax=Didymodactylos carnosus TaxID=1234261 RepID=A0A814YNW6_9BILA|nr:unnamed protein product [Didymodactylos carnosus]CAF3995538.1 unnamed protein product [Didymodactylos carnosus]
MNGLSRAYLIFIYIIGLGCIAVLLAYVQHVLLSISGERQTYRIREALYRSILRKNVPYFDVNKAGELNTVLSCNIDKIHEGIGFKLGSMAMAISIVLVGKFTIKELKAYSKADSIAQEVFGSVRTVFAYNGAGYEHQRYSSHLDEAKKFGIIKGTVYGLFVGFTWFIFFSIYAFGFWYAFKIIQADNNQTIGNILVVLMCVIEGMLWLNSTSTQFQIIVEACGAATQVWQIIDETSQNSPKSNLDIKDIDLIGDIEFDNVHFSYPSRFDVKVLNGLSFRIKSGETLALLGSSGCGRVLFGTTILENIRYGNDDSTIDEIVEAAKKANAHDFIMELPDKYETLVGERGAQLSGGQKQRVCIARALVNNPKILIFDEASSALDIRNEKIVQDALAEVCKGRTTIIIAHRLSTIRNANKICVIDNGRVIEQGDHETLMMNKYGKYYSLQQLQQLENINKDINTEEQELDDEVIVDDRHKTSTSDAIDEIPSKPKVC